MTQREKFRFLVTRQIICHSWWQRGENGIDFCFENVAKKKGIEQKRRGVPSPLLTLSGGHEFHVLSLSPPKKAEYFLSPCHRQCLCMTGLHRYSTAADLLHKELESIARCSLSLYICMYSQSCFLGGMLSSHEVSLPQTNSTSLYTWLTGLQADKFAYK